jgi:hypothetical protein
MSRLNFAPLTDAFYLGSDQIKNTQEEITKLRKIISESTLTKQNPTSKDKSSSSSSSSNQSSINENIVQKEQQSKRVGYSDNVVANFIKKDQNVPVDDTDILKIIQHPKFDDIVKNYIIVKRPEWINSTLNNTQYLPNPLNNNVKESFNSNKNDSNFGFLKQNFGNTYSTTVCSNIQNYIVFFIFTMIIYLMLKSFFEKST